jgi:hypothetical protein
MVFCALEAHWNRENPEHSKTQAISLMSMSKKLEQQFERGHRSAWKKLLDLALRELGYDVKAQVRAVQEREDTVRLLRTICRDFGDNEWADDLYLRDIVEKHLWRHLESGRNLEARNRKRK